MTTYRAMTVFLAGAMLLVAGCLRPVQVQDPQVAQLMARLHRGMPAQSAEQELRLKATEFSFDPATRAYYARIRDTAKPSLFVREDMQIVVTLDDQGQVTSVTARKISTGL